MERFLSKQVAANTRKPKITLKIINASDVKMKLRSYPAIFIQAAKHLQRERNGEGKCKCRTCEVVRAALAPLDYDKQ